MVKGIEKYKVQNEKLGDVVNTFRYDVFIVDQEGHGLKSITAFFQLHFAICNWIILLYPKIPLEFPLLDSPSFAIPHYSPLS